MERRIILYPSSSSVAEFLECQECAAEWCHTHCQCITSICLSSRCVLFAGNSTLLLNLPRSIARKAHLRSYFTSVSTTLKDTYIWNKDENFFHFEDGLLRSSEFTTNSLKIVNFCLPLKVVNIPELI